jgi:hypothetical protein
MQWMLPETDEDFKRRSELQMRMCERWHQIKDRAMAEAMEMIHFSLNTGDFIVSCDWMQIEQFRTSLGRGDVLCTIEMARRIQSTYRDGPAVDVPDAAE